LPATSGPPPSPADAGDKASAPNTTENIKLLAPMKPNFTDYLATRPIL